MAEGFLQDDVRPTQMIKDARLIRRAIKKGWNLPEKYKEGLADELWQWLTDDNKPWQARIAALEGLLAQNQQNIELQKAEIAGKRAGSQVNVQVNTGAVVDAEQRRLLLEEHLAVIAAKKKAVAGESGGVGGDNSGTDGE